jgi:hypothetical protein
MDTSTVTRRIAGSQKKPEPQIRSRDNPAATRMQGRENGFEQQVRLLRELSEKLDEYFSSPVSRFKD